MRIGVMINKLSPYDSVIFHALTIAQLEEQIASWVVKQTGHPYDGSDLACIYAFTASTKLWAYILSIGD